MSCRYLVIAVLAASAMTGCGGAGQNTATGSGSASASGIESESGSASASGSGVAAVERECVPVGVELEADATAEVEMTLDEYAFEPDTVTVDAGVVTFATTNVGADAHELAFLPSGGDVPLTDDGAPDENALSDAGAFELEAYGPGQSCNATHSLEPGTYTLFCLVEAEDGETHYDKGMRGTLEVS